MRTVPVGPADELMLHPSADEGARSADAAGRERPDTASTSDTQAAAHDTKSALDTQAAPDSPTVNDALAGNGLATADGGRAVIARLADELLPVLIARLQASSLGELEVREGDWRVRLRRPPANGANGSNGGHAGRPAGSSVGSSATPSAGGAPRSEGHRPAGAGSGEGRSGGSRAERQRVVSSPAVGYFLPRDGIGPGTSLRNGDLLGHVDVLGVRQEVVAPVDGIVARLEVEPGEAVEYGQPIARLEPALREGRA